MPQPSGYLFLDSAKADKEILATCCYYILPEQPTLVYNSAFFPELRTMPYPFEQRAAIDESPRCNPTAFRVVVFLRESSAFHKAVIGDCGGVYQAKHKWVDVVTSAYQAITEDVGFSSPPRPTQLQLLAVQKIPRMAIFVFDVDNASYDWGTAHYEVPDIPMVLVEFNKKRGPRICKAREDLLRKVNTHVAQEHRLNGWAVGPPYFQDQSHERAGPPSYPNPRNLSDRPVGFVPGIDGHWVL